MKGLLYFFCTLLISVSLILFALLVYVRAGDYLTYQQDRLKVEMAKNKSDAIDGCYNSSRTSSISASSQKSEPLISLYKDCLNDKGIVVPSTVTN